MYAKQGGCIFPCAVALLPSQTKATYTRFFWELFNKMSSNNPEDILLEFEKSAMNAAENIQPQIEIRG